MRLPTYDDLSMDQDAAINLPLAGRFLVTGPPGSGKTVVALYRAQMLKKARRSGNLVTYSRLLRQFMQPWMDDLLIDGAVDTFHGWFYRFYRANYGEDVPEIRRFCPNWREVFRKVMASPPSTGRPDELIIDEGQDLPQEFFFFAQFAADSIMVLADENQRIGKTQSKFEDIVAQAGIARTLELRTNYRNTREIAAVAAHFFTGLRTGIPEPPLRSGSLPVMRRFVSERDEIESIRRFEGSRRSASIGVLVPTGDLRSRVVRYLGEDTAHPVQEYVGGQGRQGKPLEFGRPSITVAAYASSKGLEFDVVFLPHLQAVADEGEAMSMKLYVLCSRARDELHASYSGAGEPSCLAAFPRDLMDWRA